MKWVLLSIPLSFGLYIVYKLNRLRLEIAQDVPLTNERKRMIIEAERQTPRIAEDSWGVK